MSLIGIKKHTHVFTLLILLLTILISQLTFLYPKASAKTADPAPKNDRAYPEMGSDWANYFNISETNTANKIHIELTKNLTIWEHCDFNDNGGATNCSGNSVTLNPADPEPITGDYTDDNISDNNFRYTKPAYEDCTESYLEFDQSGSGWTRLAVQVKIGSSCKFFWYDMDDFSINTLPSSKAGEPGEWVDKVTIKQGGQIFKDGNPWDTEDHYEAGDCKSELIVIDLKDGGPGENVAIVNRSKNSTGNCVVSGFGTTELKDPSNSKWVTAYKQDDDNIFLPAYLTKGNFNSKDWHFDGHFKRLPKDNQNYQDNRFVLFDGSWCDVGQGCSWIQFDEKTLYAQWCNDLGPLGRHCESEPEKLSLVFANDGANTQPPGAYGDTKNIPSSDSGGTAKVKPTCESENPGLLDTFLCGVTGAVDRVLVGEDGTKGLLGQVDNLLNITPDQYSDPNLKVAWSYFRNIASLLLVLIGLVMVIGQAISKE